MVVSAYRVCGGSKPNDESRNHRRRLREGWWLLQKRGGRGRRSRFRHDEGRAGRRREDQDLRFRQFRGACQERARRQEPANGGTDPDQCAAPLDRAAVEGEGRALDHRDEFASGKAQALGNGGGGLGKAHLVLGTGDKDAKTLEVIGVEQRPDLGLGNRLDAVEARAGQPDLLGQDRRVLQQAQAVDADAVARAQNGAKRHAAWPIDSVALPPPAFASTTSVPAF